MKHNIEFKKLSDNAFMLTGPQISFPNLWKPGKYKGALKPNLDTSFIIPKKDIEIVKQINKFLIAVAKQENGNVKKLSETMDVKLIKSKSDGKENGDWVLRTTNSFEYPPKFVNLKGATIEYSGGPTSNVPTNVTGLLRAGNYVKIVVACNPQTIDSKVKVWTNLDRIQFFKEGPNLGGGVADDLVKDEFGTVEGDYDMDDSPSEDDVSPDEEFDDDEFDDEELDI